MCYVDLIAGGGRLRGGGLGGTQKAVTSEDRISVSGSGDGNRPTAEDVNSAVDRIVASVTFSNSEQLGRFLRHIVGETLAGRARSIKAYTIAVNVFGRDSSFDPQGDSIVRVEASRLRQKLAAYYASEGAEDLLRIDLPRGGYVPIFRRRTDDNGPTTAPGVGPPKAKRWAWRQHREAYIAAGVFGFALAVFVSAVLGIFAGEPKRARGGLEEFDVVMPRPAGPSIAVLPFVALGDDPVDSMFAQGLAEKIAIDLTAFRELVVIDADATEENSMPTRDAVAVGRSLGVQYILDGTVLRHRQQLRFLVSLIDVTTGRLVWSRTYDRQFEIRSMLMLEDELTAEIIAAIAPSYGAIYREDFANLIRGATNDLEAYTCVLKALALRQYWHHGQYNQVLECLQDSIERDPYYADALAYYAILLLEDRPALESGIETLNDLPLADAMAAAERAVRLAPDSAVACRALATAHYFDGNFSLFEWYGDRAIQLNPNNVDILASYGSLLTYRGDWALGLPLVERAIALNPLVPDRYRIPLALDAYRRGDLEQARLQAGLINQADDPIRPFLLTLAAARSGDQTALSKARAELIALAPYVGELAVPLLEQWQFDPTLIAMIRDDLARAGLITLDAASVDRASR